MPRPLPLPPQITPDDVIVVPLLFELDQLDLFNSIPNAERWTLPLLLARTNRQLTRAQLCRAQRHIMKALAITSVHRHWGILATTDTLGFVNTTTLTEIALQHLLLYAQGLHQHVFTSQIRTLTALTLQTNIRKQQLASIAGPIGATYAPFLDRAAEALLPHLR